MTSVKVSVPTARILKKRRRNDRERFGDDRFGEEPTLRHFAI
jgi:hypothetical protein